MMASQCHKVRANWHPECKHGVALGGTEFLRKCEIVDIVDVHRKQKKELGKMNGLDQKKSRILIVDDETKNIQILGTLLKEKGYHINVAQDGWGALETIRETTPDLVLLDIMLPDMDGYEVCRRIKSDDNTKNIPVIFLSALVETTDKIKGFEVGGVDYITKPFQREEVFVRVRTHLRLKNVEEMLRCYNDRLEYLVAQKTEELFKAKEMAEASNMAKSRFLSNISHEIRTPLTAVIGCTRLLSVPDEEKRFVDIISSGGRNLLVLLNDILDLAEIETGKMRIMRNPVNLHAIFRQIHEIFSMKIAEKQLDFEMEISEKVPSNLMLDETRMRQVLFNIVGNALKFTEKGRISLSADYDPNERDLVIRIEDTGTGIPAESLEIIFEAFRQHDEKTTRKYQGAGLGLAISKRLIEMMNGAISLESKLGEGSVFTITLREMSDPGPVAEPGPQNGIRANQHVVFEKATILVADDIEFNRSIVSLYLGKQDLRIIEAKNGKEAFHLARHHKPDIILMDVDMPLMDGYEAARLIKSDENTKDIHMIAVTGSIREEDKKNICKCGFEGILEKPFTCRDLVNQLSRFVAHTRAPEGGADEENATNNLGQWERFYRQLPLEALK